MRLRYSGQCRSCDAVLRAGTTAIWEPATKSVLCVDCSSEPLTFDGELETPVSQNGVAGASARREYERRVRSREDTVRANHPKLGGLILALQDDPQSTKAWDVGARGEERLGRRLDQIGSSVRVLHDRRIPGTKANIDHIVVSPVGVFVIDAKKYSGRPTKKVEGGFFRPTVTRLMVGSRDRTSLVAGMHGQVSRVETAVAAGGFRVAISGILCFVDAEWPIIGGAFSVDGVDIVWPGRAIELVTKPGPLDSPVMDGLREVLAQAFPPA